MVKFSEEEIVSEYFRNLKTKKYLSLRHWSVDEKVHYRELV